MHIDNHSNATIKNQTRFPNNNLDQARSDNVGLLFSTISNLRIFFNQAASASHPSYVNSTVSYAPLCEGILHGKIPASIATIAPKMICRM